MTLSEVLVAITLLIAIPIAGALNIQTWLGVAFTRLDQPLYIFLALVYGALVGYSRRELDRLQPLLIVIVTIGFAFILYLRRVMAPATLAARPETCITALYYTQLGCALASLVLQRVVTPVVEEKEKKQ